MAKFARVYVAALFVLELLLITALLLLRISMWVGKPRIYAQSGQGVLLAAFLACFPAAIFAKDRNIWRNEFKSCPLWVRVFALMCVLYGITIALLQMVFFPIIQSDPDGLFVLSAIMLVIESISLCVLYPVLWKTAFRDAELVKRSSISFVVAVAGIAMFAADRSGYFQH